MRESCRDLWLIYSLLVFHFLKFLPPRPGLSRQRTRPYVLHLQRARQCPALYRPDGRTRAGPQGRHPGQVLPPAPAEHHGGVCRRLIRRRASVDVILGGRMQRERERGRFQSAIPHVRRHSAHPHLPATGSGRCMPRYGRRPICLLSLLAKISKSK